MLKVRYRQRLNVENCKKKKIKISKPVTKNKNKLCDNIFKIHAKIQKEKTNKQKISKKNMQGKMSKKKKRINAKNL